MASTSSSSSASASSDDAATPSWCKLMSLNSSFGTIEVTEDEIWLGRQEDCKVVIASPAVSAKHCRIFRTNAMDDPSKPKNIVYLEANSKNGTFVNGNKVETGTKCLLKHGDEVSLLAPDAATAKSYKIETFADFLFQLSAPNTEGAAKFYNIVKELGSGTFATVKLAVHKQTGDKVAIKIINKVKAPPINPKKSLMDEVEILKKLSHPNIINILDIFDTKDELQLVLELVHGGDLLDKILSKTRYKEDEARVIFKNIVEAVEYLHSHGFAHRDLKPENILLVSNDDDTTIKLTDFGVSRSFGDEELMKTLVGTPQYLAPEIIKKGRGSQEGYTVAVDMWSLGVILYVLLSGFPPFQEGDYNRILTANFSFKYPEWKTVSEAAKDLITKLLTADPDKRYTAKQTLAHPWLTGEEEAEEEGEKAKGTKRKGDFKQPKPASPKAKGSPAKRRR
eukprot:TRINITY_DN10788_c0_g1_i1.p1 TRINITY_DN10788_c0_g1~~TRINITY_DN10788_c0_g1_i1.p1  ORF type:complete len:451 (+),score=152.51 TRINITY_DN10788_c0_g1_i1:58-1410(+)